MIFFECLHPPILEYGLERCTRSLRHIYVREMRVCKSNKEEPTLPTWMSVRKKEGGGGGDVVSEAGDGGVAVGGGRGAGGAAAKGWTSLKASSMISVKVAIVRWSAE